MVWFSGKLELAYRVMCTMAHGNPPTPEHEAAHYCGKGHEGCIHPRHLGWETTQANEAHKLMHGTLVWGEDCHLSKLTEDQVRFIRANPRASGKSLAERFNVSEATIGDIRSGRSWKHLDG
ncbi:hypothetical protein FJ981_28070 [Mesorhizobium sp. B1-1-4]|uniref:hypothetical protein n=1 Tax=Mesorhizobium sp. B1-1-4 TaxID=2589980 RepID=UPI00112A66FE|nr:hypothetical protein [Mesorhizobium sp. B1-1-4]TPN44455.1 hypothetical protein FJ981_28070 [Mesorhizobium sp. B1-1-4]